MKSVHLFLAFIIIVSSLSSKKIRAFYTTEEIDNWWLYNSENVLKFTHFILETTVQIFMVEIIFFKRIHIHYLFFPICFFIRRG